MQREKYIPLTQYRQPKYTPGGEFLVKSTLESYKGFYIVNSKDQILSGKNPEEGGEELIQATTSDLYEPESFKQLTLGIFLPMLKKGDVKKGITKRYFIKDKVTNKIVETDLQTYQQARRIPSKILAEVDWNIKAPAEDLVINGYTYEGSASKNKKLIQSLEKTIPGISSFITDYSLLIQSLQPNTSTTQTVSINSSADEDLKIFKKANFDKRD